MKQTTAGLNSHNAKQISHLFTLSVIRRVCSPLSQSPTARDVRKATSLAPAGTASPACGCVMGRRIVKTVQMSSSAVSMAGISLPLLSLGLISHAEREITAGLLRRASNAETNSAANTEVKRSSFG